MTWQHKKRPNMSILHSKLQTSTCRSSSWEHLSLQWGGHPSPRWWDRFLAYNGGTNIIDSEEDALAAEVAEAIPASKDSPEYKHDDEKDTVTDDTVKVLDSDRVHDHQAYQDLNQEKLLGNQDKETLNSMKTSTRPGTGGPAPGDLNRTWHKIPSTSSGPRKLAATPAPSPRPP
jgi:hypothetical protein